MITFNTQKDFEDAVMNVLNLRLSNKVFVHDLIDPCRIKVEVLLLDRGDRGGCISRDWDEG